MRLIPWTLRSGSEQLQPALSRCNTVFMIYLFHVDVVASVADPHLHSHDFCLLDPYPESAFQMRIPDADADSGEAM
jgi:hypothetical protein